MLIVRSFRRGASSFRVDGTELITADIRPQDICSTFVHFLFFVRFRKRILDAAYPLVVSVRRIAEEFRMGEHKSNTALYVRIDERTRMAAHACAKSSGLTLREWVIRLVRNEIAKATR